MTNRSLIKFLFLGESINGYNLYFKKNKIIMSIVKKIKKQNFRAEVSFKLENATRSSKGTESSYV